MWNTALFPGSVATAGRLILAAAAADTYDDDDDDMVLDCNYDLLKYQLNNIKDKHKLDEPYNFGHKNQGFSFGQFLA